MKRLHWACLAVAIMVPLSAFGQFSINISVDENCNGLFTNTNGFSSSLPCAKMADPGPGGLASALTYGLLNPPGLVAGDLILLEPGLIQGTVSDIIRFNPNENGGSLVFYSDIDDTPASLADTGFPTSLQTNTISLLEVGPEGANGISYTPTAGQPGFVTGAGGPITYVIKSDVAATPEPASIGFLIIGIGVIVGKFTRRNAA